LKTRAEPTLRSKLAVTLNDAMQTKNELAEAFRLDPKKASAIKTAEALPTDRERRVYLTCRWLEALCAAEARVCWGGFIKSYMSNPLIRRTRLR
jgi:hypothetical protein